MNVLFVHEIDYFSKPIFEFQIVPEIMSCQGHNVYVVDYPQGPTKEKYKKDVSVDALVFEGVSRTCDKASVTVFRPCIPNIAFLGRILYFLKVGRLINKVVQQQKIDLIYLYSIPNSGWQTIRVAKKNNIPVVFRIVDIAQEIVPGKIYKYPTVFFERYVYKKVDLILALTPKLKEYVLGFGVMPKNVAVQLSGVDTKKFKPGQKNFALAHRWGIQKNDKIVLFVGTMYEFACLEWLIQNWQDVLERVPQAKLMFVGGGPVFDKLKNIIKNRDLDKNVILTGWQDYALLPDYINLSDVCVNLFKVNAITYNIIPTKLFQYQACAKPVVAFPLPGMLDILRDERDGVFYAKNKKDALDIITNLLIDLSMAKKTGDNGRYLIEKNYKWSEIVLNMHCLVKQKIKNEK